MGKHTFFAYGNASQEFWDKEVIFGLTRNQISLIIILLLLIVCGTSLDWDWIFGRR